jgi:hypothetical protein
MDHTITTDAELYDMLCDMNCLLPTMKKNVPEYAALDGDVLLGCSKNLRDIHMFKSWLGCKRHNDVALHVTTNRDALLGALKIVHYITGSEYDALTTVTK